MPRQLALLALAALLSLPGCGALQSRERGAAGHGRPAAEGRGQDLRPVTHLDTRLNGLHVAKDDPSHVADADHYCDIVNDDLIQCALYDGTGPRARLVGVEYILTAEAFDRLSPKERALWHPHNYEVLSGMLVAPGMPEGREEALMRRLLNSYGKTWQTWPMGTVTEDAPDLPVGEPTLAWSFNADDEAPPALVRARDLRLDVNPTELRKRRAALIPDARPQQGVDAMADDFPNRRPIRGVREKFPQGGQEPGTR